MRQRLRQQGAAFREFAKSRRGGGTLTASAALLCAGTLLVAGGSQDGRDPYVAAGPAEQSNTGPHGADGADRPVPPSQGVKLVPQPSPGPGDSAAPGAGRRSPGGQHHPARQPAPVSGAASPQQPSTGGGGGDGADGREGAGTGSGPGGSGDSGGQDSGNDNGAFPGGGSGDSAGRPGDAGHAPAKVQVGKAHRSATDQRWCEKVTVTLRNTGGQPATSGRVILGTHIIGALGTDWGTVTAQRKLPVPIRPGEQRKKSWKVCVDKWRVPLGMRVETQDVRAVGPAPDPDEKKQQQEKRRGKGGTDSGRQPGSDSGAHQPGTDGVPEPSLSRQPGERSGGLLSTS